MQVETGKVQTDVRKRFFILSQELEQAAKGGCAISTLGGLHDLTEHPALTPEVTLL